MEHDWSHHSPIRPVSVWTAHRCRFTEGVFLATFVLITQNRMMAETDRRDHLGLQIELLAEQELTMALRMLRELCKRAAAARC